MADGCGRNARSATSKARIKPIIYTTTDGQVIVEDEFLNFLVIKMKTLNQDDLILLAVNHFGSEWIESSKKVIFDLCPSTSQRCVAHKGPQKDANNVKSCLKLLNEVGENIPRVVSHYLDELPTVTFNSLDISCLLGKIQRLSTDISAMKRAMSTQTNICEDLRLVTAGINQRLCVMDQPEPGGGDASISQANEDPAQSREVDHASSDCVQPVLNGASGATASAIWIRKEALGRSLLGAGLMAEASALDVGVVEGVPDVRPKIII